MKLIIDKDRLDSTPEYFLRSAGYAHIEDRQSGQASFARRLGSDHYPRLHLYINYFEEKIIFNLHLDQKKPGYQGQRRHNAEYDAPVLKDEIERLRRLVGENKPKIEADQDGEDEYKKPLWQKIFKV